MLATIPDWLRFLVLGIQFAFIIYFGVLCFYYLILSIVAFFTLHRYTHLNRIRTSPQYYSVEPPITLIAPAYNEEPVIVDSVRSMLNLEYPEFEIIVVCDGSKDRTFEVLADAFALEKTGSPYQPAVPTKPVVGIYQSKLHPKLRVVYKQNGGKADSLNTGLNLARYPLVCAMDGDTLIARDGLYRLARPFVENPDTLAVGGTIRLSNGSVFKGSTPVRVGLPATWLGRFQVIEYCRAFLTGRLGWEAFNGLLIISGAFGLFHRQTVIDVGGWLTSTVGEDMELVMRLHRYARERNRPYVIAYSPDAICWTEAPETLSSLKSQRIRWQRGLSECLQIHQDMLRQGRRDRSTFFAYLYFGLFEWAAPIFEFMGYFCIPILLLMGLAHWKLWLALAALAYGTSIGYSTLAFLMECLYMPTYINPRDLMKLAAALVMEPIIYRPRTLWWRLVSLIRFSRGMQATWEALPRAGIDKK